MAVPRRRGSKLGGSAALLLGICCGLLCVMVAALLASMIDSMTGGVVDRLISLLTSRRALAVLFVSCVVALCVRSYNHLVRSRLQVREAWATTDAQLKLRADLVPQLVATVSAYARHEQQTFENVTRARIALMCARGPQARGDANQDLTAETRKLLAVGESYPELRASENFATLQKQLSDIESKIAWARQFYNQTVLDYNTRIAHFPRKLWAPLFGFTPEEFFEATDRERGTVAAHVA